MDNQALLASLEQHLSRITPGDFRAFEVFRQRAAMVVGKIFGTDSQYVADVLQIETVEPLGWDSGPWTDPAEEWRVIAGEFRRVLALIREDLKLSADPARSGPKRTDDINALIQDLNRLQFNNVTNANELKKRAVAIAMTRFTGTDRMRLSQAVFKLVFEGSTLSSGPTLDLSRTRWEQNRKQLIKVLSAMRDAIAPDGALQMPSDGQRTTSGSEDVFIVHGHEHHLREDVAGVLRKFGLRPIILDQQASSSLTVIEKLERYGSTAGFAVAILTPDDEGRKKTLAGAPEESVQPRARQNVIFELGWFFAKLGRDFVVGLLQENVDEPSDLKGVLFIPIDRDRAWITALWKALRKVGYDVSLDAFHGTP